MKPNLFKYSMLTVGVVTALGITVTANADSVTYDQDNAFAISNVATASYLVAGNTTGQTAESNEVIINVTETGAFSLIATTDDGTPNDDISEDIDISAQVGATVDFTHTLTNDGNVTDTYTIAVSNLGGDDFDYDIPGSTISYQKLDVDGAPIGSPITINNGDTIELDSGESAEITISALADPNDARVIGDNGILSVTATSTYLDGKGAATTVATNTDNAITTTPIYAITKSAQTNLGTNRIDLNNPDSYVDYTITVENQGTAAGTDVTIEDVLPAGLVAIQVGETNYVDPTVTGGSNNPTPVISADGSTVTVTGQDIDLGDVITFTFRARAADTATTASDFTNYAAVKDDLDDDGDFDLIDSSGDANDTNVVENTFEDPTNPTVGQDDNSDASVTPVAQTRDLTVTGGADQDVALQSTDNGYSYIITNDGTDITEADAPDEVLFTITPTTDVNQIDITTVFVDTNGDGVLDAGEVVLTPNAAGQYDLNDADPDGLLPGESVNIGVLVDTNGSGSNNGTPSDIGTFEEFTFAIVPQTVVEGTPVPTDPAKLTTTTTTTLEGIQLLKYQAAAACDTAPNASTLVWTTGEVNATADQCAFYKLEATNTFSNVEITDIVLTDTLASTLTYQGDFASDTSLNSTEATPNISGNVIVGTFASLVGQEVGNIYFSATISQTGDNAP